MYKVERIKELVEQLNRASDVYYNTEYIVMEDKEFDKLLDELKYLEDETNFRLANSPTQNVGAKVLTELNEVEHNHPMLSLDKCHSVEEVIKFANGKDLIASIKLDGLTVSILYQDGELVRAETRGNGYVGSDITEHIKQFQNVPLKINKEGTYIVDGEAIITDDEFAEINKNGEYKNSRNLASGTLSVLDTSLVAKRKLRFFAWDVIEGGDWNNIKINLHEASLFGFDVVPNWYVSELQNDKVEIMINDIFDVAKAYGLPCDGIVFKFEDIEYGKSLGATGHHFRNGIAFKAKDETYETKLLNIEWTVGRTGTITPTAVFEPVEIDGTTVERASVHNVSVLTKLDLHVNDIVEVCKSNQIIPQINRNISSENRIGTDYIAIPGYCPVCDGMAEIKTTDNSQILVCTNPDCTAKKIAQFTHFASKNCMNIDGLSEATIEKFIEKGFLHSFRDIYHLDEHRNKLIYLDGFGVKSIDKLLSAINKSRNVKLENFIAALGIEGIGLSAAKTIAKYFDNDSDDWYKRGISQPFNYTALDDFGEVMKNNIHDFAFKNMDMIAELMEEMNFIIPEEQNDNSLEGLKFCITGSFNKSRDELKKKLESKGAKFVSSVSKNLDILFAGEKAGSKLTKAQQLGIKVADENELLEILGE